MAFRVSAQWLDTSKSVERPGFYRVRGVQGDFISQRAFFDLSLIFTGWTGDMAARWGQSGRILMEELEKTGLELSVLLGAGQGLALRSPAQQN